MPLGRALHLAELTASGRGLARASAVTSPNPDPREPLKTLMEENPDATEQHLFELLVDAVKDEPDVRDAIIREYVWRVAAPA